jgi:hypothetical protein
MSHPTDRKGHTFNQTEGPVGGHKLLEKYNLLRLDLYLISLDGPGNDAPQGRGNPTQAGTKPETGEPAPTRKKTHALEQNPHAGTKPTRWNKAHNICLP